VIGPRRGRVSAVALAAAVAATVVVGGAVAQPAPRRPRPPAERPPAVVTPTPTPLPARCGDPLTGTWRAKVWRAESSTWDRVTLLMKRTGVQLSGTIIVESWDGDADQTEPAACADGSPDRERWTERLSGSARGGVVDIRGSRVRQTDGACEPPGDASSYRPDHFRGALAEDAPLLVTTNDDGGVDQGRPHHFQRLSCRI